MEQPPQSPGGPKPKDDASRGATDRSQRRTPPPEGTGDEAAYFAWLREKRTPVAVEMLDGTVFRGIIEYYDRDMIKVNRLDGIGPNVFVRKKHVRVMWEESPSPSI